MKKGVVIAVRVYVEGEAEPVADFAEIGKQVVLDTLKRGAEGTTEYRLTLRHLEADDDPPDEDQPPADIPLSGGAVADPTPAPPDRVDNVDNPALGPASSL